MNQALLCLFSLHLLCLRQNRLRRHRKTLPVPIQIFRQIVELQDDFRHIFADISVLIAAVQPEQFRLIVDQRFYNTRHRGQLNLPAWLHRVRALGYTVVHLAIDFLLILIQGAIIRIKKRIKLIAVPGLGPIPCTGCLRTAILCTLILSAALPGYTLPRLLCFGLLFGPGFILSLTKYFQNILCLTAAGQSCAQAET